MSATAAAAAGGLAEARPARARRRPFPVAPWLLILPFAAVFLAFKVAPLGYALWLSLFRETLVGGDAFVGLDNYAAALADPKFWRSVRNMLVFGAVQVPVMLGLALLLALALDSGLVRAKRAFKIAFYLPYAVPTVVAALLWGYLYGPAFGPFAQGARALGLPPPDFLSASWIVPSLANVVTWEYTGYNMVILFAALQAVPRELEEAAALDGAGPARYAWHVKVPLVRPAILLTVVFSVIGTFQLFNEPQLMKAIAPHVVGDHFTPNLYAYSLAFTNLEYNYAGAVSFLVGLIVAAVSYASMLLAGRRA